MNNALIQQQHAEKLGRKFYADHPDIEYLQPSDIPYINVDLKVLFVNGWEMAKNNKQREVY
jgi:hypothetical protein